MGLFGKFPKTKKQQILRLEASITYLFVKIYICIYDIKLEKATLKLSQSLCGHCLFGGWGGV